MKTWMNAAGAVKKINKILFYITFSQISSELGNKCLSNATSNP